MFSYVEEFFQIRSCTICCKLGVHILSFWHNSTRKQTKKDIIIIQYMENDKPHKKYTHVIHQVVNNQLTMK